MELDNVNEACGLTEVARKHIFIVNLKQKGFCMPQDFSLRIKIKVTLPRGFFFLSEDILLRCLCLEIMLFSQAKLSGIKKDVSTKSKHDNILA